MREGKRFRGNMFKREMSQTLLEDASHSPPSDHLCALHCRNNSYVIYDSILELESKGNYSATPNNIKLVH